MLSIKDKTGKTIIVLDDNGTTNILDKEIEEQVKQQAIKPDTDGDAPVIPAP